MMRMMMTMNLIICFVANFLINTTSISGFSGWIDPDTAQEDKKIFSHTTGAVYDLVMSDEFNRTGRKFKDGDDPMWTAIDKSDDDQNATGQKSLHFYKESQVTTVDGKLVITTTSEDIKWKGWNPYKKKYETMSRHFKSGMIQSWNKFCFTGGILEVNLRFPGRYDVGGLWPAVWLLGNLGRATFLSSTNLMWPWSYAECDRDLQMAQEISGCDRTQHYSMKKNFGRGATEIDLIEVMPGPSSKLPSVVKNNVTRPYGAMTLQLAPGISKNRPHSGQLPDHGVTWYRNLSFGAKTSINPFFYGTYLAATKTQEPIGRSSKQAYQCDAISAMTALSKEPFATSRKVRLEWQPGDDGYLHWYVDDALRFGVEAMGLRQFKTKIPDEPSYVIINTAISTTWGFPNPPRGCIEYDCKTKEGRCGVNPGFCESLPAKFYVESVRVYQDKSNIHQNIGCNPIERPTSRFIKAHDYRYCSTDQAHSLKSSIVTGGGRCSDSVHCGEGYCSFMRCRCHKGWQGPNCLVPTYKNDFPDWEKMSYFSLTGPAFPWFLYASVVLLVIMLIMTIVILIRKKQRFEIVLGAEIEPLSQWL